MCAPDWKVGFLGSAFFIGWATSLLWLPRFGDKFGRQKLFAIGMTLNLIAFTILLVTNDINVMTAVIFMQGFLTSIRMNIGFLFMMEIMPRDAQTGFGTLMSIIDASTYLLATLYFFKISKEWSYFVFVGYIWNWVSAIGAWFLPESPRFLCEKGNMYELERSLKVIARINGKELNFDSNGFKRGQEHS